MDNHAPPYMRGNRPRGWQSLGALSRPVTRNILTRRGFQQAGFLSQWRYIVGDELADICTPLRVRAHRDKQKGILHIAVKGPSAILLQHQAPQIIQRINTYLGWPAIECLTFSRRA